MSDSLETAKEWCEKAKQLIGESTKALLAKQIHEVADQLDQAFNSTKGRPPEISATEWSAAKDELETARTGRIATKQPPPLQKATQAQKQHLEDYEGLVSPVVEKLLANVAQRKLAFAALNSQTIKDAIGETGKGLAKLKQLDDPTAALNEVKLLKQRMDAATKNKPQDLPTYMNMT
jgi:hypothetical protein